MTASTTARRAAGLAFAALLALGSSIAAPAAEASSLDLTVDGVSEASGHLMIALFDDEAAYDGDGDPVAAQRVSARVPATKAVFTGLAPGTYGIKLYHDVNDNGDMDSNLFGLPTEPFAFSNNARGMMGPAKWEEAAFEVPAEGTSHTITLGR